MRIFVDGRDNCGWHMDEERRNIKNTLKRLGIKETKSIFWASIVHNIWWNNLLVGKKESIKKKKHILVTSSNYVNLDNENYELQAEFELINGIAEAWVSPSTKQKDIFERHGVKAYYQPFYLDLDLFRPINEEYSRAELLKRYDIPEQAVEGRIIIGSYQRDSLGSDLSQPKWQKGPEILIELLKDLPKDKFILLLSGPRRHFVIKNCKKYDIPYYYIGEESEEDDLLQNTLKIEEMPYLYALADMYLVTSVSEGGPKAVMEATTTKTYILSTDVGLAGDFLNKENVFADKEKFKERVSDIINNYDSRKEAINTEIEEQYKRAYGILNLDAMDNRLLDIYYDVLGKKRK